MCVPFGAPGYTPGKGFTLVGCDRCGNSMWIGPNRKEGVESLCFSCVVAKYGIETVKGTRNLEAEGK